MNYKTILLARFHTGTPELLSFHGRVPVQNGVPVYWDTLNSFRFMRVSQCPSKIRVRACIREEIPPNAGGVFQTVQGFFQEKTGTLGHGHENKGLPVSQYAKRLGHRLGHGLKDWDTDLVCRKFKQIR